MRFYLGTHEVSWLARVQDIPLFVSHRRLARQKKMPRATTPWALDSGGFTELSMHGRWKTTQQEYLEAVHRYSSEVGGMEWCAPMDWMCEEWIVEKTGLSVREHQERTVQSVLDLRAAARGLHFIPVLQGATLADYEQCIQLYGEAGVNLLAEPVVGVGSVCRRQSTGEVHSIMEMLSERSLKLHGFGVKTQGLKKYGPMLASADSLAWSFRARSRARHEGWTMPGCTHASCANCMKFALRWRLETVGPHIGLE